MGGINGRAHTPAWSSYGEVHEPVRTVCEYNVDECGITEKIAISITGKPAPVPRTSEQTHRLGCFMEKFTKLWALCVRTTKRSQA